MCWNGKASTTLSIIGFIGCSISAYKKDSPVLWGCLAYFSLMEVLQAFTYNVINSCFDLRNQVATSLGYLHISLQPFFINAISMYFIPKEAQKKIATPVFMICFICFIVMFVQAFPYHSFSLIPKAAAPMCSDRLCSVSGNWHIAWEFPINNIFNLNAPISLFGIPLSFGNIVWAPYIISAFLLPIAYGSWRFTLYHFLVGPVLARLTTSNINEFPAIWCLFSIGLLLIVIKTRIRNILFIKKLWWFDQKMRF
ncbi:hypothetical protein B488_04390 [Liberibacter crescens BT-1]|uniref:Uncharacterized protein n=1 Tax=Liberibacter crescens (strain BT-1) TaxID=1215343 RepID=L0EVL3_LIBCB|nr:DUF5765 domain-containing protein [Liberibacter crescens]AGA64431.1 hypothetical protein B488_04390 [Liberibacter crescens BT-1]AMC12613.1 hypothetical protein RL73_02330 [Liberibacter crescens]